jgi:hypothetical protein
MGGPVLRAPLVVMRARKQEFTVLPDCFVPKAGVFKV